MPSFRRSTFVAFPVVLAGLVACGGAPPPPPESPAPPSAPPAPAPVASSAPAADSLPASDDDDPNESSSPIALTPEITRPWDKASFPPAAKAAEEEACWKSVSVTGSPDADFAALIASCGAPMGLREYAQPAHGHLHSVKDKRDTFSIQLYKGLCYRYFAVGDSGIKDIDILVEKKGNVLVGDDKQTGPIAIIDAGKTWCMTTDAEYLFNVEVDGEGKGKYIFGVWARPK